ncbi:hypothetical protein C7212DRAFT_363396 [Tuber magnatum]|uniref:Uncharacterized protein n=1 Tax=Tuber magnatum TaxID=42249 RepID=A0A317STH1_9PEZI|nr:hypothetical protein C7212DRAFT_363396 [Tuber magnatum]
MTFVLIRRTRNLRLSRLLRTLVMSLDPGRMADEDWDVVLRFVRSLPPVAHQVALVNEFHRPDDLHELDRQIKFLVRDMGKKLQTSRATKQTKAVPRQHQLDGTVEDGAGWDTPFCPRAVCIHIVRRTGTPQAEHPFLGYSWESPEADTGVAWGVLNTPTMRSLVLLVKGQRTEEPIEYPRYLLGATGRGARALRQDITEPLTLPALIFLHTDADVRAWLLSNQSDSKDPLDLLVIEAREDGDRGRQQTPEPPGGRHRFLDRRVWDMWTPAEDADGSLEDDSASGAVDGDAEYALAESLSADDDIADEEDPHMDGDFIHSTPPARTQDVDEDSDSPSPNATPATHPVVPEARAPIATGGRSSVAQRSPAVPSHNRRGHIRGAILVDPPPARTRETSPAPSRQSVAPGVAPSSTPSEEEQRALVEELVRRNPWLSVRLRPGNVNPGRLDASPAGPGASGGRRPRGGLDGTVDNATGSPHAAVELGPITPVPTTLGGPSLSPPGSSAPALEESHACLDGTVNDATGSSQAVVEPDPITPMPTTLGRLSSSPLSSTPSFVDSPTPDTPTTIPAKKPPPPKSVQQRPKNVPPRNRSSGMKPPHQPAHAGVDVSVALGLASDGLWYR